MPRQPRRFRELAHSWVPFGLGKTKPRHFRDMLRIIWRNRDNLGYAWRILNRGVCDGCALGTTGLKDWTVSGTHLCMVRLELLRLNTMPALDIRQLEDVNSLQSLSSKELRECGRLPFPVRRRPGEAGFTRLTWSELWEEIGRHWGRFEPQRTGMFVTSRGITNEVYYVAQKVMRFLGSANVDNSARLCHSPSTAGLKSTIGVAATTCSYKDWYAADVIVFFGSNPANDQPVSTKYLVEAKKRGARVLSVNTYREPGMERYWVPSNLGSAVFGTNLVDRTYLIKIGGDLAFLTAVQKLLVQQGQVKKDFLQEACANYEEFCKHLDALSIQELVELAGCTQAEVEAFAEEMVRADRGVLVWSMGITQHAHGADTVRGIVNLALLREYVGRSGCGLMPIRGHSGVQGGAEMGAYSTALPGGLPVNMSNAKRFSDLWGFAVPDQPGLTTADMLDAAEAGALDAFYCIGGNFLETMPAPDKVERALSRIPLRIHSDIVLTKQMFVEPKEAVYLLPARTRYEQKDGGTETTTERRVVYSPYIPGHDVGESRSEWEMLLQFAQAVHPQSYSQIHLADGQAIRDDIAAAVPAYQGIEELRQQGDQFQWGGPHLCADRIFPTADAKAHFALVIPPQPQAPESKSKKLFQLATRRGKQFNSMVQAETDPLTGADRDHVFMSSQDAQDLDLHQDSSIILKNSFGEFRGRVFIAPVTPGNLQGHWPEVNGLIPPGILDREGGVPDYNARVEIIRD